MLRVITTKSSGERGYALLMSLILSALMAVSMAMLTNKIQSIVKATHTNLDSLKRYEAWWQEILSWLSENQALINSTLCTHTKNNLSSLAFCFSTTPFELGSSKNFPLIRTDQVFEQALHCPQQGIIEENFIFPTTDNAARSSYCCTAIPQNEQLTIAGNIELLNEVEITTFPLSLTTTGFINSRGSVAVQPASLIIAGGDLHINKLVSANGLPAQLTLISLTGAIYIAELDPKVAITAYARFDGNITQNITPPAFLEIKKVLALGILQGAAT